MPFSSVYGATLSVTILVSGTATIIEIAAAIFAFLCSGPGAWYGWILSCVDRSHFDDTLWAWPPRLSARSWARFFAAMLLMAFRCDLWGRVAVTPGAAIARRGPSIEAS